jgi:replicative DNA helicase
MSDEHEVIEADATTYDFDEAFQTKIVSIFARDTSFAKRVTDLIKPEYFTNAGTGEFLRICQDHLKKFGNVPDKVTFVKVLKDMVASKRLRDDLLTETKEAFKASWGTDITNAEFVAEEVATFAKHQAIQDAMMKSLPLLEKGDFAKIRDLMASATQVGLADEWEDYDYFGEIKARTAKREDIATGTVIRHGITTGYPKMDVHLYHHGWGRKELSCVMGPAKSGKSLSLGDFGKNASLAGYNVIYVSLEVAKEIISERIDAALSDTLMRELVNDRSKVEAAIQTAQKRAGVFKVIDFPSGTLKVSALERVLDKYRDKGVVFDMVIVDYADIMAAEMKSPDLRENLRQIFIDLRAMAHKYNVACLTATQTNREGAKAVTAKATDVGDDWNKARTVDILLGINATEAEKQAGEARLFWALSRNTADGFSLRIKQNREKMQFLTDVVGVER